MLWFSSLPTIRETPLLRTVQRQTRTGVPEHTFDHPRGSGRPWTSTLVGAASAHRSCMGAASSSCNWPAGSCVWELRRPAVKFFHGSCKFCGSCKNRCQAAANVWELHQTLSNAAAAAKFDFKSQISCSLPLKI